MSATFDEIQFPTDISFASRGGPMRSTQIVIMGSGAEQRNARWINSRHSYDIGYGMHSMDQLNAVIAFFEARNGRLIGFRFKDWADYQSCGPDDVLSDLDQAIGTGDGVNKTFQLTKTYTSGGRSYVRAIAKPVTGTTVIAMAGTPMPGGWSVDTTTGIVTFVSAPAAAAAITAGFQFDVPVRFDSDKLEIDLSEFNAGQVQNIPLVELLL